MLMFAKNYNQAKIQKFRCTCHFSVHQQFFRPGNRMKNNITVQREINLICEQILCKEKHRNDDKDLNYQHRIRFKKSTYIWKKTPGN